MPFIANTGIQLFYQPNKCGDMTEKKKSKFKWNENLIKKWNQQLSKIEYSCEVDPMLASIDSKFVYQPTNHAIL